jgi:phage shock protein C
MAGPKTRYYRDKANGKWAGVCAGFANYFGMDVSIVRLIFVMLTLFTGMGLPAYFILAWTAPDRDDREADAERTPEQKKFWLDVRKNPRRSARALRARFREMDRRLARTEAYLTSPDRRLAREIDNLR